MAKLYSKRTAPPPNELRHDIPEEIRHRIIATLDYISRKRSNNFDFDALADELQILLVAEYGDLCLPGYRAARIYDNDVAQHFISCDDEMALDFIEACFQADHSPGPIGADAINAILGDSGIGFELRAGPKSGKKKSGPKSQAFQIIKKDSQFLHVAATQPVFELLSDQKYKGANEEFLKAHEHYRHENYKECLNECLKAFESTMKIICHKKKWPYNQHDTARTLIKTCLDNGLIPTFSEQQMTSLRTLLESGIPTMRNKQSSHGQGKKPIKVSPQLTRYALHLTAATILLLVENAEA